MSTTYKDPAHIYLHSEVLISGSTGPVGATGPVGPMGVASVTGATGPVGVTGSFDVGPTGPSAATGPTGSRGATGPIDTQGQGDTYYQGFQGYQGEDGPIGATGATGAQGRTGGVGPSRAPRGVTGTVGPIGRGSYGGTQVPFFADPEVFLTPPTIHFGNKIGSSAGFLGFFASTIYLFPVYVPYARTFTSIAFEIDRLDNFNGYRVGIYNCTEGMHPTVALYDSGIIGPPIGIGRVTTSFSLSLSAKPYFLAFMCTGTLNVKTIGPDQVAASLGWRRYADGAKWYFEAQNLQTRTFFSNYLSGFTDLSSYPVDSSDTATLLTLNSTMLLGIR